MRRGNVCVCVCVWLYVSVHESSGVTHGGEAELHSLVFASESNRGRLNPVWSFFLFFFFFPRWSWFLCIFLKTTTTKKKSVFFLSFLFKCSVYLLLSTVTACGGGWAASPSALSLSLRCWVLLQLLGGEVLLQVALVAGQRQAVCDPGQQRHWPAVLLHLGGLLLHVHLVAAGQSARRSESNTAANVAVSGLPAVGWGRVVVVVAYLYC